MTYYRHILNASKFIIDAKKTKWWLIDIENLRLGEETATRPLVDNIIWSTKGSFKFSHIKLVKKYNKECGNY